MKVRIGDLVNVKGHPKMNIPSLDFYKVVKVYENGCIVVTESAATPGFTAAFFSEEYTICREYRFLKNFKSLTQND